MPVRIVPHLPCEMGGVQYKCGFLGLLKQIAILTGLGITFIQDTTHVTQRCGTILTMSFLLTWPVNNVKKKKTKKNRQSILYVTQASIFPQHNSTNVMLKTMTKTAHRQSICKNFLNSPDQEHTIIIHDLLQKSQIATNTTKQPNFALLNHLNDDTTPHDIPNINQLRNLKITPQGTFLKHTRT